MSVVALTVCLSCYCVLPVCSLTPSTSQNTALFPENYSQHSQHIFDNDLLWSNKWLMICIIYYLHSCLFIFNTVGQTFNVPRWHDVCCMLTWLEITSAGSGHLPFTRRASLTLSVFLSPRTTCNQRLTCWSFTAVFPFQESYPLKCSPMLWGFCPDLKQTAP